MRPRILVVDDDERIAASVRRALIYEGYDVDVAHDGEAALDAARADHPDIVVLDVMLPGMDGVEVCRRLRAAGDIATKHREAIEANLEHGLSQGLIESTNTKIQLLTRIAFGFHGP